MRMQCNSVCNECLNHDFDFDSNSIFTLINLNQGEIRIVDNKYQTTLNFLISGELIFLSHNHYINRLESNEIILLPQYSQITCKALKDSTLLQCRLESNFNFCDCYRLGDLEKINPITHFYSNRLLLATQMESFVCNTKTYLTSRMDCTYLYHIKRKELFFLMRAYYSKEALYSFFFPLIGRDIDFKLLIIANYLDKNMKELAQLTNCSLSTFQRRFKDNFGEPFYQWILSQKASLVYDEVKYSRKPLLEIAFEYNFSSPMHFNRFFRAKYGITPGEIRKNKL